MISVAEDFSRTPAGRYRSDGPASGERFREDFLVPELHREQTIEVSLDGTAGYPSSFLEEAFGGLIRHKHLTVSEAKRRLHIIARAPEYRRYERAIWAHIERASTIQGGNR